MMLHGCFTSCPFGLNRALLNVVRRLTVGHRVLLQSPLGTARHSRDGWFDSSPTNTHMFAISRTPAFRNFQRSIGNSTFYLNTTVVGLELVARGGTKPLALTIKWQPPKHPEDVARQARQFLV